MVVSAGDVDGDELAELLAAAPLEGATARGAVYLQSGAVTGSASTDEALARFTGAQAGDQLDAWLDDAADLDGDGVDDFAAGASQRGTDLIDEVGRGYLALFLGPPGDRTTSAEADARLACGEGRSFGKRFDFADLDGHGDLDLAVGGARANETGFLVPGPFSTSRDVLDLATAEVGTDSALETFALGDLGGNGHGDLLVGSRPVRAVLGPQSGLLAVAEAADWTLAGNSTDLLADDLDGDGIDEVVPGDIRWTERGEPRLAGRVGILNPG